MYGLEAIQNCRAEEPQGAGCFWPVGAGAAPIENWEPEKIKDIRKWYICYSSLGKILSFYGSKKNYFT